MSQTIKIYLERYTNHRYLISAEQESDGWIRATVMTIKGAEAIVFFRISPADKKTKIEYGISQNGSIIICSTKLFNHKF
jgi:hypothetical protein